VISAIVAIVVFGLVISVVVAYALEPGPTPTDIAVAYEQAWDRLDFETLWTLSGSELRDGLDRHAYSAAKAHAYSGRAELRDLAARVEVADSTLGAGHAMVRTKVTLRDGAQVCNDVVLTKRSASWVVTGYQLVPNPPQPV
jgi:hypothetical protein